MSSIFVKHFELPCVERCYINKLALPCLALPPNQERVFGKAKGEGGLSLPNYLYYYWAANFHKLMFWVDVTDESPVWSVMEQHSSNPVSLCSLLCAPLPLSKNYWTNNPVIQGSLKIWTQFRIHFKHKQALIASPILANVHFPPSLFFH